jgi:hypothetical protein
MTISRLTDRLKRILGSTPSRFLIAFVLLGVVVPQVSAQQQEDFDSYKVKLEGYWLYSNPSGTFQGANDPTGIDLQRDLHFNAYSTFAGKVDWKFTRKNHLYVQGLAFNSSRSVVLDRTIVFRGQTFQVGSSIHASLSSPLYVVGYQYDFIRRRRGHLGIAVQANIFDTHASISAAAQIVGGQPLPSVHASGSLLAPIPVAGPQFRFYLTNSPKLFVDGNVYGMYFFGYGNYVSSSLSLGYTINRHVALKAGYQLGSRLEVNDDAKSDRLGVRMTQQGPFAGVEIKF